MSGKTNYLVAGNLLEDGRAVSDGSKHRTAVEKQVPIISEDEFLDLLNKKKASAPSYASPEGRSAANSNSIARSAAGKSTVKEETRAVAPAPTSVSRTVAGLASTKGPSEDWTKKHAALVDDQLWVDKYKPAKLDDMIGSNELVSKLS